MRNRLSSVESDKTGRRNKPWMCFSDEPYRLRQYFVLYTALFLCTCCVVFCWYFLTGRTFIWKYDGWYQHYKALVYYADHLRSILRELFVHHRLVLPEWEFALGEGNDILQSLHYYVIGDPFSLFSVLVPTRFLWIYYDFMILLRLYLSGVAFSCLCFYTRKQAGRYAVMAGALSYVFCDWTILNANRHPYFLNPMLYFPLILLGVEKVLRREKPYVLIVSVFLAAISNFYFFYAIVLMTVAYVAVRLITKYKKDLRSMGNALLRVAGGAILGTVMGSIILLPVLFAFLQDGRMDSGVVWHLVYPLSYYSELPGVFLYGGGSYWLVLGYASPVLPAIFLLFLRRKRHLLLKVCFLGCLLILLLPAAGQLLNGMSYMSNRWCWAFALLCAYMLTVMWPELMNLKPKEVSKLAVFLGMFLLLAIGLPGLLASDFSNAWAVGACMAIAYAFLLVLFLFRRAKKRSLRNRWEQTAALALVILSVGLVSLIRNAPFAGNYMQEATYAKDAVEPLFQTEAKAAKDAAAAEGETGFYRYSGQNLAQNAGLLQQVSGTNYYWSISNPAISAFRKAMGVREPLLFSFRGYDERAALLTLSAVRYYVLPEDGSGPIPYGFLPFEAAGRSGYTVYKNGNALPLSYGYDAVISEERWNRLSPVEQQEAMLQAVLLADYHGETQDDAIRFSSRSLPYSIDCADEGVTLQEHGFAVTAKNASVTLRLEGLSNCETYFSISGLSFDGEPQTANLRLQASSGVSKTIEYHTEAYTWYNDRHDFTVNLDYAEDAVTSITLAFSAVGFYSFDSIEVICQPMDRYAEQVSALQQTALQDMEIGTDTVRGKISLNERRILCFSIPYADGWTAYVDGEEAVLYQANLKNMALVLDAGDHEVELRYRTPYLRMGACVSAVGFVGFFVLLFWNLRKKQRARCVSPVI